MEVKINSINYMAWYDWELQECSDWLIIVDQLLLLFSIWLFFIN